MWKASVRKSVRIGKADFPHGGFWQTLPLVLPLPVHQTQSSGILAQRFSTIY
jgi:hypothetical protein